MGFLGKEKETIRKEKSRILRQITKILADEHQITLQERLRMLELLRKE